jgi:serine/threonine protein kinase
MLSPSPSIVTKYFSNSLNFYLVADSTDSLRLSQANQILKAVKWLHSKGIIHCDIKPENLLVLVDRGGRVEVKLCDFDSARHIGETICHSANDKMTPLKFTPAWVCPEIFYYSKEIDMFQNPKHPLVATVEMDLFSLGLVVACTLSKERTSEMTILPSSMDALRFAFDTRSYLKRIPSDLVSGCLHAVEKLWSFQPRNRGSIDEVINAMSAQGRTTLSNELQEESRRRELDASHLEKKISDLANVIQSLESQCLSSSPELTELLADVSMTMSQEMKMHFGNYLENIKDLRDDVIKGQRILEALQDQR